jgi:hypothetical protein
MRGTAPRQKWIRAPHSPPLCNPCPFLPQVVPPLGEPRRSADHRALSSGLRAQAREMASSWTCGGWTIQELADRYNCTHSQAYHRVRRYGAGTEGRVPAPRGWGRRSGLRHGRAVEPGS